MTRGDLVPQIAFASQSNVQNRHKNTTAIKPDKFTITSTRHGNRIAILRGEISNNIRFSVIFPCARLFWLDRGHALTAVWNVTFVTFCTPRVQNVMSLTCVITLQVKFISTLIALF